MSGFSVYVSDPTALIERNFDFEGEQYHILQGDNKYFVEIVDTAGSGEVAGGTYTYTLDDPAPVEDPDNSGTYIFRVTRVRGTTTTDDADLTYTYDSGTGEISISSAQVGDIYKISYSATSYITGEDPFTANDTDLYGVRAHSAVLYLGTSNRLYKVQSATVDVRFDREDIREIGNEDAVARGTRNKTVTVTLGKLLDSDLTIEEVLRGESSGYGKIDMDELSNDLTFICAIYSDSGHGTFKWGFMCETLAPTEIRPGTGAVDTHVDSGVTLAGEDMTLTSLAATLGL